MRNPHKLRVPKNYSVRVSRQLTKEQLIAVYERTCCLLEAANRKIAKQGALIEKLAVKVLEAGA